MKKAILVAGICFVCICLSSPRARAQGAWVNSEGCYCGRHPWPPVSFEVKGSGSSREKAETLAQMDYWNRYAGIFDPCVESGTGSPQNGVNEVNTFMTAAQAKSVYGVTFNANDYGIMVSYPRSSFGVFNECKDFNAIGCASFTETDVILNANFAGGWTTDPTDVSKALVQTTALHEIGHAWGAHHVFSLPSGNSYSCMNYMFDQGGKYVTRMDANTIRYAYSSKEKSVTDFGVFPLSYGNSDYAENYASTNKGSYSAGDSISIGPVTVQNCGTTSSTNLKVSFYLSTDTYITSSDSLIGTWTWNAGNPFNVNGQYTNTANLNVPNVGQGWYYVGAIVTNWGSEDSVAQNNRCILYNGGTGAPSGLRRIYVSNWFPQGSSTPQPTPRPTSVPDCPCTSWCDDNYLELTVSPTSISSGGTLKLDYACSFGDANFYNVPVNVFLALIKDPVAIDQPCSTGQALSGGTVYMWEDRMRSNYIYNGRVGDPTWSWVMFPASVSSTGALNITLTAPPGKYIWAAAFVESATGRFIRPGTEVEASNSFTVK